ncbi:MAG: hypothetical protein P4L98_02725 [Ancalomicrobiaceae bacterium]|nr:hypothetical protein [Ancalomicrobiaceae bacterium]
MHDHEHIVEALETGDTDVAIALMNDHLAAIELACILQDRAAQAVDLNSVLQMIR